MATKGRSCCTHINMKMILPGGGGISSLLCTGLSGVAGCFSDSIKTSLGKSAWSQKAKTYFIKVWSATEKCVCGFETWVLQFLPAGRRGIVTHAEAIPVPVALKGAGKYPSYSSSICLPIRPASGTASSLSNVILAKRSWLIGKSNFFSTLGHTERIRLKTMLSPWTEGNLWQGKGSRDSFWHLHPPQQLSQ